MPFTPTLAARLRKTLTRRKHITQQKMFGGLAFLLKGRMCCGVLGDQLVLRQGPEGVADALKEPHTREMDFTGRPMKSLLYVTPEGYASDPALRRWVARAVEFAASLPAKE